MRSAASQPSSMFTYVHPYACNFSFIMRAASRTFSSSTESPQQFQLFHPIGGVRAIRSPIFKVISFSATPFSFMAFRSTLKSPLSSVFPVIKPVEVSNFSPAGSPDASKVIGRLPLAIIVIRNGFPGRAPYTRGLLIRGVSGASGVRMYFSLATGFGQAGIGVISPRVTNFTFNQSAWSYIMPSPHSSTNSNTLSMPERLTLNSFTGSPFCITPLFQSSFLSPIILNCNLPAYRLLSSAPTKPLTETALPPKSYSIRLIE